jgi:hypothetical protein
VGDALARWHYAVMISPSTELKRRQFAWSLDEWIRGNKQR